MVRKFEENFGGMKYGYEVVSADISDIALNKVKDFNKNVVKLDMRNKLPL